MRVTTLDGNIRAEETGVIHAHLTFDADALADYTWPLIEIRGRRSGPRLCVSAGVHVNEVSSIEAAIRLQYAVDPEELAGTISIIPVVNQPALYKYTEYNCPIDGKNMNFSFPGDPAGTFSERLCDAIVNDWSLGAECYVDLHGGDLRENVSRFAMFQRTGDRLLDANREALASCFDADIIVGLPEALMQKCGRPPTGLARLGRTAIMSEAGANGIIDDESVLFHLEGVVGIAAMLGMLKRPAAKFKRSRVLCEEYLWVEAPVQGQYYPSVEPAMKVKEGQRLGIMRDFFGRDLAEIVAPQSGHVLWRMTHPTLAVGQPVLAIAVESRS